MSALAPWVVDALSRRSKILFGERLRLPLAFVIANHESGIFTQTDLAEALGVRNSSSVVSPLNHLVQADFVQRHQMHRNERARFLQRNTNLFWEFVRQQAEVALKEFGPQTDAPRAPLDL